MNSLKKEIMGLINKQLKKIIPYFAVSKHPLKVSTLARIMAIFARVMRILAGIKCKKGCLYTAKYGN
jgi:hypothetical protein